MVRLKSLLIALVNWFTMKKARHNRALRDLIYLSKSIEDFFFRYRLLDEGAAFKSVFQSMGQVRIDATEMAYQTGIRIRRSRLIEGKDLPSLIEEVYTELGELKRSLFTRTLSNRVLSQRVTKLDMAFENLLGAISDINYK